MTPSIPPFFLDPGRYGPDGSGELPAGVCRGCGCVDEHGCPEGCAWTDESGTLCTVCADLRPTCGADGRQLAPEPFVRWQAPGIWIDDEGRAHLDVARLLCLFDVPDQPEVRAEFTAAMEAMFAALLPPGRFRVRH